MAQSGDWIHSYVDSIADDARSMLSDRLFFFCTSVWKTEDSNVTRFAWLLFV
jgi:hypothetical protein